MGMLLRVVEEGEVRSAMETCVDNLEEIKRVLEDNDYENSSRRLDRISSEGDYSIHAWGMSQEEKEVYKKMMDGDPLMVAVDDGDGDEPSDYYISYVTELEFCLHKDVCEGCGEEVAEAIGFDKDKKYVAFSTIPPVSVPKVSGEEYTLEYLQEYINSQKRDEVRDLLDGEFGYIEDTYFDQNNDGDELAPEGFINILNGWGGSVEKPTVWAIGTGGSHEDDGQGTYWHGDNKKHSPKVTKRTVDTEKMKRRRI